MSAQLLVCAFAREHPLATASGRIASPLRNAAPSAVSAAWVALGKLPFAANAGICAEVIACDFHQRLRLADFIPAAAQLRLALARPPLRGAASSAADSRPPGTNRCSRQPSPKCATAAIAGRTSRVFLAWRDIFARRSGTGDSSTH